jgi:hypothetical protein
MSSPSINYFSAVGGGNKFTTGTVPANTLGIGVPILGKDGHPILGGGLRGFMPQGVVGSDRSAGFAKTRFFLKEAWNTSHTSGSGYKNRMVTPFRAVNNAGDLLCRQNYSCGGTCQTPQSRPGLSGLAQHLGSTSMNCTPSVVWSFLQIANPQVPSSTCNGKFVYDGSDYTIYRKKLAMQKNYNDRSDGGNDYSGAQSAIRAIRRY